MKSILIMGCGWYGWPLAELLVDSGFKVFGSTTTEEKIPLLQKNKIQAFPFGLTDVLEVIPAEALKSDYLVLNIPPGGNLEHSYNFNFEIRRLVQYIWLKNPQIKIIFISSTSVLDNYDGVVDESFEPKVKEGNGAVLATLETWLMTMLPQSVILRFAGLYGEDRHPAKFFSGRTNLDYGSLPVNLTHIDDAIGATIFVMTQQIEGEILHVCADDHPTRREFFTKSCERLSIDKPHFRANETESLKKIISNAKLTQKMGYKLIRPSVYMGIT